MSFSLSMISSSSSFLILSSVGGLYGSTFENMLSSKFRPAIWYSFWKRSLLVCIVGCCSIAGCDSIIAYTTAPMIHRRFNGVLFANLPVSLIFHFLLKALILFLSVS